VCRRYLIDLVRVGGNGGPRRPEHVRSQEMHLTVEEVTAAKLRLRLAGEAKGVSFGPGYGVKGKAGRVDGFRLWGVVESDRRAGAFTRFDAVALSETGHYDEHGKKVMPLGVAFELTAAKAPADRVRPSSYFQNYFGKKK